MDQAAYTYFHSAPVACRRSILRSGIYCVDPDVYADESRAGVYAWRTLDQALHCCAELEKTAETAFEVWEIRSPRPWDDDDATTGVFFRGLVPPEMIRLVAPHPSLA